MKKGFTLIELIAVIVILSLIALIVIAGTTRIIKKSKSDIDATQKQLIIDAAGVWSADNLDKIPDNGCYNLEVSELLKEGLFSRTEHLNKISEYSNYYVKICSEIKQNVETPIITYEIITE